MGMKSCAKQGYPHLYNETGDCYDCWTSDRTVMVGRQLTWFLHEWWKCESKKEGALLQCNFGGDKLHVRFDQDGVITEIKKG